MSANWYQKARRVSPRCRRLILFIALCLGGTGRSGAAQGPRAVSFLPPVSYDKPGASGVLAADLDGDGKIDIAVAGPGSLSLFYGKGDGSFEPRVDLPLGNGINDVQTADVNGDGLPDLILTQDSRVVVLLNQGNRTYNHAVNYAIGGGPAGVTVADFNGDGRPDLAVSNSASNNICVLLNKGDGTFLPAVFYPAGQFTGRIISGDWNGDGAIDLAVANGVSNNVLVYLGDGKGGFTPGGDYRVGNGSGQVVTDDFNGDGKPDLATANWWDNGISVLFGDGTGRFGAPISYPANGYPGGMASADLDGDGAPDLVHANGGTSYFTVHQNAGDGNFLPPVTFPSGGSNTRFLAVGDFNGDGLPDVVTSSESSGNIAVLINNTPQPTPAIRSLTLDPASVIGGCQTTTGTVTLTAPAPAQGAIGGVVVLLASSNPAVTVPAEILIPQGTLQTRFSVVTPATAALQWASISAAYNGTEKRAALAVRPMGPLQLTIDPSQVIGGQTAAGQVTIPCPAGPAGLVIALASSSPLISVPAAVTVPPGAATAAFPIRTDPVAAATAATISAGPGTPWVGAAATASLQLLPPLPPQPPVPALAATALGLVLFPNSVPGGLVAIGLVTLAQPAGPSGLSVTLASSSPAVAAVPASIIVLPGAGIATFPIITSSVAMTSPVTITAGSTLGAATATLQVLPFSTPAPVSLPAPTNLTARVLPGFVPAGTVQLTWQDNSGGQATSAVWRRTPTSDWTQIAVLVPSTTSFLDPNLSPGITYTYRVRAFRGAVASDWSNEASATALLLINGIPYAPSGPQETLAASFTQPDGGVTANVYQGYVLLHVTGVGQAYANVYSDAFYLYSDQFSGSPQNGHDGGYYQLAFGTSPLGARDVGNDARNFLVGPLPPYNPAHDYTVVLDTRLSSPGYLHFGVSDGGFSDNTGAYVITVSQLASPP